MTLSRWNPWGELFSLHDQMDQLFGEAVGRTVMPERGTVTHLPLDIRQTDEAFFIEASVPGFRPEDVEITLDENVLTIRGRRESKDETNEGGYVRRERLSASVYRQVSLPNEVKADEITASFNNGVLTITVPRAQRAQPKRIPVSSGAATEQTKGVEAPVS
jgi:HSP20 family protein